MPSISQIELIGRAVAGRFTIKRFLGEGGMATVYVAEQDGEPRELALKIMNADLMSDRTFVRRFQREAKAAARVQHPNSVAIIDYGIADTLSYIAMELVRGDDSYVLLERDGAMPQTRAVRILVEVCEVLSAAHELGIVHRDLKPENIMVVADATHPSGERVKVLDFGIAKILAPDIIAPPRPASRDSEPNSAVTRAGTFIGTPSYMSPEQCGLMAVDTRADIYTCGVLLFQLLTGRLPFEGQTPLHTATMHIHQEAPKPTTFAPSLDPRLEVIILKALEKKPENRYQTAQILGAELAKILPDLASVTVSVGPPSKRQASLLRSGVSSAPGSPRKAVAAQTAPKPKPIDLGSTMVDTGEVSAPARVLLHSDPVSDPAPELIPDSGPNSEPPTRVKIDAPDSAALFGSSDVATSGDVAPLSSELGPRRYGPQRTEVIEGPASVDPETPLRGMKATLRSSAPATKPAAGQASPPRPIPSGTAKLATAMTDPLFPGSAGAPSAAPRVPTPQPEPTAPISLAISPPSSVSIAQAPASMPTPSFKTTQPMARPFIAQTPPPPAAPLLVPAPLPAPVAAPMLAPFDVLPQRGPVAATSSMTRGILIGFLAAVLLMGLVMVAIVLLTRS